MRALALKTGVWLLLGGFPEKCRKADRISNTSVLLDPEGTDRARSTARCTCSTWTSRAANASGSRTPSEPGGDVVVAPTPWGGLGLSICYDLRFPELYRAHGGAGRAPDRRPVRLHLRDRQGSLARAAAGARDREPGLPDGARAVRRSRRPRAQLRPRAGRRSLGRGDRRVRRPRGLRARAARLRYQDKVRAHPALPRPTAGCEPAPICGFRVGRILR